MKVLQINTVSGIGSTGRIAADIHSILLEKGHESFIAYGRGKTNDLVNNIKIGTKYDNYHHVVLTRLLDKHGFGSKKSTHDFIKEVEKINPDIIHLHNIHGYFINIKILFDYLKRANKPVIWTLHDCWAFTGHCTYFDYVDCNKWKSQCSNCPEIRSYPSSLLVDSSQDNFLNKKEIFTGVKNLTLVTPSQWLANLVSQSFLKEYPVKVVNNGVDTKVFKPTKSEFRSKYNIENKFIILGVASIWDRRKGYKYFEDISSLIEKDEVIVLVGLSQKQKEKLPENIIGISKTHNVKELAEIYSAADVFMNPTLEDNFPTTNLESLACGTPVITFNTGGSIESIDERCGIIVENQSAIDLIRSIRMLKKSDISNKDCLNRSKLYNKENIYNHYIDLYTQSY
ncbi:glycosyltransferase [Neobacillus niacini]|uniref:glycosyltransferase n=1 Tax=Neobacillus niacini TaxID=86668 RepID=UPI00203BA27A|nr:glycosyltransferase [Neobacillus niacini]